MGDILGHIDVWGHTDVQGHTGVWGVQMYKEHTDIWGMYGGHTNVQEECRCMGHADI